jgi:hypothetical protein
MRFKKKLNYLLLHKLKKKIALQRVCNNHHHFDNDTCDNPKILNRVCPPKNNFLELIPLRSSPMLSEKSPIYPEPNIGC